MIAYGSLSCPIRAIRSLRPAPLAAAKELRRGETIWPGPDLIDTYTALRAWCVKTGHGLGQKEHEAGRWVAATAIWLGVPLITHDAIFANVKDLDLLTKLDPQPKITVQLTCN